MVIRRQVDPETGARTTGAPPKKSHAGFLALLFLLGIALAAGIVYEWMQRQAQSKALASTTVEDADRAPVVNVGHARRAPSKSALELPCQTVAMVETPIYARVDGYLKQRVVDIGNRVKKGQLLMEIETPELDQQIVQARAMIAQSKAALEQSRAVLVAARSNAKLAKVTAERWKQLADQSVFSKQDLDDKALAYEASEANVKAAEETVRAAEGTVAANDAGLRRLEDLKSFARVVAPFDGVITFRSVQSDVGTLITSGNTTSSREIMRVAQIDVLRVFVQVPQAYAPLIQDGQAAELVVDELPGRVFHTKVAGTTHSVDATSRTMLAVLLVDNKKEELLPGMYTKARFSLPHAVTVLVLPAEALVIQSDGPRVAVVGEDRKVRFHKVTLGRDLGAQVEILSGLSDGDTVVLSPTDAVREGVTVEPKERK